MKGANILKSSICHAYMYTCISIRLIIEATKMHYRFHLFTWTASKQLVRAIGWVELFVPCLSAILHVTRGCNFYVRFLLNTIHLTGLNRGKLTMFWRHLSTIWISLLQSGHCFCLVIASVWSLRQSGHCFSLVNASVWSLTLSTLIIIVDLEQDFLVFSPPILT